MTDETSELTIETVTTVEPADLSDDQKTFLEEHKADLTDEQATKYSITKEVKVEKEIEPETRIKEEKIETKKEEKEEDEEVAPEDEAAITKVVQKQLNPVQKRMEEQANIIETTNFIAAKPEFSKYRDTIIKHMNHPAYKNIPVDRIAKMVAGDDLIKIGAQKEREAQTKAAATKAGGSSVRTTPTGKDWHTATKEEFEAQKASVLGRQGQ